MAGNANSGRRSEKEDFEVARKLTPLIPKWVRCVEAGLDNGDMQAARLYAEYMWGRPTQKVDMNKKVEIRKISVDVQISNPSSLPSSEPITPHIELPNDNDNSDQWTEN